MPLIYCPRCEIPMDVLGEWFDRTAFIDAVFASGNIVRRFETKGSGAIMHCTTCTHITEVGREH